MTALLTTVLRMSFYGTLTAVLAAAVFLLLRRSRCSKTALLLLWAAAALRLSIPWFPASPVSVMNLAPASRTEQTAFAPSAADAPAADVPTILPANGAPSTAPSAGYAASAHTLRPADALAWIWLAGAAGMIGYGILSYLCLHRRLRFAIRDAQNPNIWYSDRILSPCVTGLLHPRIYLTFGLTPEEKSHILAHERQHLHNGDHIWKTLGWLVLSMHWFNPVLWMCWFCFLRALEEACDQRVLRALGEEQKTDYSQSLLTLATGRRFRPGPSPLAFGEGDTKSRVRSILRYKKPLTAVTVCVLVAAAAAAVVLTTGRTDPPADETPAPSESSPATPATTVPADSGLVSFAAVVISNDSGILVVEPESQLADGVKRCSFPWSGEEFTAGSRVAVFAKDMNTDGETGCFDSVDEVIPLSGVVAQWQIDLTHDGTAETVSAINAGSAYYLLVETTDGRILWYDIAYDAHAGQNGYYLYERDGLSYLLQWVPYMSSGYASYHYQLFSLTAETGQPLVFQSSSFEGDYTDPMAIDPEQLSAFQSQINTLLADSVVLLSTNGDTKEPFGDPEHPVPAPAWSCQDEIDYFTCLRAMTQSTYTFTAQVVNTEQPDRIQVATESLLSDMNIENQYSYDVLVCTIPVDDSSLYHEDDTVTVTADGPLYRWELPDEGTHVSITLDAHGPEEIN